MYKIIYLLSAITHFVYRVNIFCTRQRLRHKKVFFLIVFFFLTVLKLQLIRAETNTLYNIIQSTKYKLIKPFMKTIYFYFKI